MRLGGYHLPLLRIVHCIEIRKHVRQPIVVRVRGRWTVIGHYLQRRGFGLSD